MEIRPSDAPTVPTDGRQLLDASEVCGRAVDSFAVMEIDLARQFDRVCAALPDDPAAQRDVLAARVETRLRGRPNLTTWWTPTGSGVETHFARIPLDRVTGTPAVHWTFSYGSALSEFAQQMFTTRSESASLFADMTNRVKMDAIDGPAGTLFASRDNGAHRLAGGILLGLDAVYGDVVHQTFPHYRTSNNPEQFEYWTSLLTSGLAKGYVDVQPQTDGHDDATSKRYVFKVESAVVPWILESQSQTLETARLYDQWVPGSLEHLGAPRGTWIHRSEMTKLLNGEYSGNRAVFDHWCEVTRTRNQPTLKAGESRKLRGLDVVAYSHDSALAPPWATFTMSDSTDDNVLRGLAIRDAQQLVLDPIRGTSFPPDAQTYSDLLLLRDRLWSSSGASPSHRLGSQLDAFSEEVLGVRDTWRALGRVVDRACTTLERGDSVDPTTFELDWQRVARELVATRDRLAIGIGNLEDALND
jgi:hypothetical protein